MNKQYPRSTEAYSNFFLKLSKVIENNEVATSKRKLRREAAKRRLASAKKRVALSKFNSVEASAREYDLGELEKLLENSLAYADDDELIILFEVLIPRGWRDSFSLAANAFRVSRISGLGVDEFHILLISFLGWLFVPNFIYNLIFSGVALSFVLLKFYGEREISITAERSIHLPELRLLFKELKAMHLSPRILLELGYKSRYLVVSLQISPDWHRLKNLL